MNAYHDIITHEQALKNAESSVHFNTYRRRRRGAVLSATAQTLVALMVVTAVFALLYHGAV